MAENINVISRKFYNQIVNGEDFTLNTGTFTNFLKGNSGGKYKAIHDIGVEWYSVASQVGTTIINGFTFTATADTIERQTGSWVEDGFKLGDTIKVVSTGATNDGTYTISNITDLVVTCSGAGFTTQTDGDAIVVGFTTLNDIEFQYGLIENDDQINFNSKIDGNIQKFRLEGVSGSPTSMTPVGIQKTWQNGSCKVSTGAGNPINITNGALNYSATHTSFLVEHEFILLPTYLDGEIDNMNNVDPPELWESNKCLKYVFSINMASTLSDPNSFHYGEDDLLLGNTGWINETYNGNAPNFTLNSISYADTSGNSLDGVQKTGFTDVTVVLDTDLTIDTSTKFVLTHFLLPNEDQYKGAAVQTSTMEENFLYEGFVGQFGDAPTSGTILDNVDADVVTASQGQITFRVDYSGASAQAKIEDGNSTFLGLLIKDNATANTEMMLKLSSEELIDGFYGTDEAGLITFSDWEIFQHPEDDGTLSDGHTDMKGFVEDKLLSTFTFEVSKTDKIDKVTPRLVAYNSTSGDFFDIQKEVYDFSIYPIAYNDSFGNSFQQINLDTTRGFKLASASDFNKVECYPVNAGIKNAEYKFNWAFAFNWEDYKALAEANSLFYDNGELNNGLNQNSSHYSLNGGASDWGIYLFFDFDIESLATGNITTYRQISPELEVLFYDEYSATNPWAVAKKLTNQSGTDTSNNILDTENTKISFAFTSALGDVGTGFQGVIRMEEYQNGGLMNIWEISSYKDRLISGNPLTPLTGETYAKITKSPSDTLTIEAEIDKDLVNLGRQYQISARVWIDPSSLFIDYEFEDGTTFEFEDSVNYDFE